MRYKIYNIELLTIIEAFKNYFHYIKNCKNKILVLSNYDNLY